MKAKLSVIVPIYNVEKYIERCVRSLFGQTLDDIEFIFVDDCTPDNSVDVVQTVLRDFPHRRDWVKIVKHEQNKGLVAARNTGLRIATGEYIAHCDSDDWVELDMYESLYNEAIAKQGDFVAADFFMNFETEEVRVNVVDECDDHIKLMKSFISYGWTTLWNFIAKRSLYEKNDLYGYEGLNFCEDYGSSVRLIYYAQKYVHLKKTFYHYNRANQNSMVRKANDKENLRRTTYSQIEIYKRINDFFKDKGVYQDLEEELSWRMLAAKRGWLADFSKRDEYLALYPESNKYIDSNPLCSKKDKICQKVILKPYWKPVLSAINGISSLRSKF